MSSGMSRFLDQKRVNDILVTLLKGQAVQDAIIQKYLVKGRQQTHVLVVSLPNN
jgi:hypothetical protein